MLLPSTTLFRSPFPSFPSLPSFPASRPPPVEAHERWCVGQLVQAFHVQALGVGGFEELREQLGHAAGADHVVALAAQHQRSEERRVGQECVSSGRSGGWPYLSKKKTNEQY